ncbi:monovalent cation:proton antiporter-2 (CPA2) family protein [Magnetovibrio sp.]|uniref:monovalent cation:proton antiporter-2 (CPA2) family protein n=1 Tax=Magnetovibrio sp. TaxID=2024836 RepID=UPI002F93CC80
MTTTMTYMSDIAILLAAAVVAVPAFQSMRMGAVPGFVVAGMVVGPYGLELIGNVEEVGQFAELGVVLLLFIIGIELNPRRLWMMRRLLFGLGSLQVVLTSVALALIAHYLFDVSFRAAVLIGPALALSSTAFVLQLLTEHKMLTSEPGRASIAILLLQDLAVVPLLALVSLLAMPEMTVAEDLFIAMGEAVLIIVSVILGGRYLLQPVLHRVAKSGNAEVFTASAVLLVLGAAVLMEHVGLSMAMGAFLAGLLIADSSFRHQVIAETQPFRGLLLGLFFMSMGMTLDLGQFLSQPLFILALVAALVALKAVVIWPLARLFGLDGKNALTAALLLAQSGEFALVIFTVALGADLLEPVLFQQLLLVVIFSMLVTPLLARLARQIKTSDATAASTVSVNQAAAEEHGAKPVLIIGFGRVGHKIGDILTLANIPFAAIDNNPTLVAKAHGQGMAVFYGDAERPAVLKAMGAENARIAIIALDDYDVTEQLVAILRANFPNLAILARGHNRARCDKLKSLGVAVAVSETLETSIELARVALNKVDTPDEEILGVIEEFRRSYHAQP